MTRRLLCFPLFNRYSTCGVDLLRQCHFDEGLQGRQSRVDPQDKLGVAAKVADMVGTT